MVNRLSYFNQFTSGTGGGGGAAIATGTYVGDGTNDRVIVTGLSSPPRQVIVTEPLLTESAFSFKTSTMAGKLASIVADPGGLGSPAAPIAIVGNNFTVDDSFDRSLVNASGSTYFWTALG